jgi:hypothetical protein
MLEFSVTNLSRSDTGFLIIKYDLVTVCFTEFKYEGTNIVHRDVSRCKDLSELLLIDGLLINP